MVFDHFVDNTTKWIYEGNNHWVYNGSLAPTEESEFEVFYNVTSMPSYGNVTNKVIVHSNETGITFGSENIETPSNPEKSTMPSVNARKYPIISPIKTESCLRYPFANRKTKRRTKA